MTRIEQDSYSDSRETPRFPIRALMGLAATALTACIAVGAVKGYEVYQDLQHPQYEIELDKIAGGTP